MPAFLVAFGSYETAILQKRKLNKI